MIHEAKLPYPMKNDYDRSFGDMDAPPQMMMGEMGGADRALPAGVSQQTAKNFLEACTQEYMRGVPNAVGDFYSAAALPENVVVSMEPFENRIQSAVNTQQEIDAIRQQWGLENKRGSNPSVALGK